MAAALVEEAGNLAAQFTNGPVAADALDLVEAALGVIGKVQQLGQVVEGETVEQLWSQ